MCDQNLLISILINAITVHLVLVYTGFLEVVILLKIHLVKYVLKRIEDVGLKVFKIFKRINGLETLIKLFQVNVDRK